MGRTAARQIASQPLSREPVKGIDGLWKFRSSFLAPIVENPVIGFGQSIGPKCDRDRRRSSEIRMVGIDGIIHPLEQVVLTWDGRHRGRTGEAVARRAR